MKIATSPIKFIKIKADNFFKLRSIHFGISRFTKGLNSLKILVVSLLVIFSISGTNAQVVINESVSTNPKFYADEDGDYPDWIELYNAGINTVNLNAWGVTDNNTWNKWQLPSIDLNAGERLLIFASGKNRNGFIPDSLLVNHWETALYDSNYWKYFIGDTNPDPDWNKVNTDNSSWLSGKGGFGYGDGDDNTLVPVGTVSEYYEKYFTVINKADLVGCILSMDYDDGFIAYLNGTEIARAGISGPTSNTKITDSEHEAFLYRGGIPEKFVIDYNTLQSLLKSGTNKLSIEIHNFYNTSGDMTGRTWLHFGIRNNNVFFGPNPSWFISPSLNSSSKFHTNFKISNGERISLYNSTGVLQDSVTVDVEVGHSRARINDGGQWCFTNTPTPDAANTGICYTSYSFAPVVFPESGYFESSATLSMTGTNIHYTLNGADPDSTMLPYTSSINLNSTTSLRAQSFEPGKLPSKVVTKTYLINEPTTLPIVSIVAVPRNLFIDGTGGLAVYDSAAAYHKTNKASCTIQYFDKNHQIQFTSAASFAPVGGYSLDFPQKSIQFVYDEDYGASGDVSYNIFSNDKPGLGASHGFRVRSMDDDWGSTRMRDIVVNQMSLKTYSEAAAYQHVAVFINGEYWGHYAARELLDKYFMRDNLGAQKDSVDMILSSYPDPFVIEEGGETSFNSMNSYLINNDLSDSIMFNQASDLIDYKNWVDYFAAEIYSNNIDWFPSYWYNNTRIASDYSSKIKWKYILWDVSDSQGVEGNVTDDLLYNTLANPYTPNPYTDMMNSLLKNSSFKNYFINRFCDLLNYQWTNNNINKIIDDNVTEIAPEINAQANRWNSLDSVAWLSEVQHLKNFHAARPNILRSHIQNYFSLNGKVNITLNVNPANAGYIKISSIIPDSLPWTGIYFNGNPVKITAVARPGYSFVDWDENAFINSLTTATFTNNISSNTNFTANFAGSPISGNIIFSELNYNSDSTLDAGDWVEIKNATSSPIDISDWKLQDQNFYNQYLIPSGTVIPADSYLVLADDTVKFRTQNSLVKNVLGNLGFNFSNSGESISLFNSQNQLVKSFTYSDLAPWRTTPDGYGRTLELKNDDADPNLAQSWFDGCMKGSPGVAFSLCDEQLIPDEINYKSSATYDAGDWIELRNISTLPIDISGWRITDKKDNSFTIPAGITIPPDGYLVVYQNSAKFVALFPDVLNKVGPTNFGFDGSGDVIRIYDSNGELNLSVCYDDNAPFPKAPDGQGYSLQLIQIKTDLNEGSNWTKSCFSGSPGIAFDPTCSVVGIEESAKESLIIYPNPASDIINISSSSNHVSKVEIIDSMGKLVHSSMNQSAINISNLPEGIYLIRMHVKNDIQERKLIKLK